MSISQLKELIPKAPEGSEIRKIYEGAVKEFEELKEKTTTTTKVSNRSLKETKEDFSK